MSRYEIDEDLTVRVYMEGLESEPWITQPNHPENREWRSRAEAEEFAKEYTALADEVASQAVEEPTE